MSGCCVYVCVVVVMCVLYVGLCVCVFVEGGLMGYVRTGGVGSQLEELLKGVKG